MAVDNSRKKSTPPRPNLPPEGQPWGRWVTDTLNELKLETGGVKREVISSNKNHNAQLQMSAQQKREIVKVNLKAEEALNIALAASGSTTIYFAAPETPERGDIWYENVTGIWFRWVDDQWVPITDETLLEALEAILAQRIANDDKVRTFAQDTEPTGVTAEHVGDLWYDTDDKNKLYRWDGLEWVPIRDAGITEAQEAADEAQSTADDAATKAQEALDAAANASRNVFSPDEPPVDASEYSDGTMWWQTGSEDEILHTYELVSGAWVLREFSGDMVVGTLRGVRVEGAEIYGGIIEGETSLSLTQGGFPLMESTSEGLALYPPGTPTTRTVFRTADLGGNGGDMGIVREERVGAYWRTRSLVLLGTLPNSGGDGIYTDIETGRIAADRISARGRLNAYRTDSRKGVTHASPRGAQLAIQSRVQMDTRGDGPLEAVQGTFSRGTGQTITSTGQTRISLNTISPGSSNIDLATGGLIQPAEGGVYAIEANIQFDGGSSGSWRSIYFRMNGEQVRTFGTVVSGASRMVNATAILAYWDQAPTFEVYTSGGGTGMEINAAVQVSVTRIGG